jgi:predicted DNA-binding transcriptional regulator YafY
LFRRTEVEVNDTPKRTLELLALLQRRPTWTGGELGERLGVTDRTIRRDVERLRELGFPVEAAPGATGGYQLGRGGKLPPLVLGEDEAVAVALGLRSAIDGSVTGLEEASLTVLSRLEQLLPAPAAARVRAIHEATAQVEWRPEERVDAAVLSSLGQACHRSERVRFSYADRRQQRSERLVEPYRLVRVGPRWYLVGHDCDRRDCRTFRLDRLSALERIGTTFTLVDPPDAASFVRSGLTQRAWPYEARIRVRVPSEEVATVIPGAAAVTAEGPGVSVLDVGGYSPEHLVRYLAGLAVPCEVVSPDTARAALVRHLEDRLAAVATSPSVT